MNSIKAGLSPYGQRHQSWGTIWAVWFLSLEEGFMDNNNKKELQSLCAEVNTLTHRILAIGLRQRNQAIYNLYKAGVATEADIARALNLSRERIRQIIDYYEKEVAKTGGDESACASIKKTHGQA